MFIFNNNELNAFILYFFKTWEEMEQIDLDESSVKKAEVIEKEEENYEDSIAELDSVFDTVVFPNNRPTKLQQDYRGSKFSLNGFIKFVCTRGQYKKIYENMIGSPRKDYMVTLILDTSVSMAGMAAIGSIQTCLAMSGKFIYMFLLIFISMPYLGSLHSISYK